MGPGSMLLEKEYSFGFLSNSAHTRWMVGEAVIWESSWHKWSISGGHLIVHAKSASSLERPVAQTARAVTDALFPL